MDVLHHFGLVVSFSDMRIFYSLHFELQTPVSKLVLKYLGRLVPTFSDFPQLLLLLVLQVLNPCVELQRIFLLLLLLLYDFRQRHRFQHTRFRQSTLAESLVIFVKLHLRYGILIVFVQGHAILGGECFGRIIETTFACQCFIFTFAFSRT